MKTDRVINGVLVKATRPYNGEPYVWPDGVTRIADYALAGWRSFNQPFSIPAGVTEIEEGAFSGWCSFNQPFSLPEGVTEIGDYAFYDWRSFNQPFSIPAGVTKIGDYAFYDWRSFNQPNSCRAKSTYPWLRIDNRVFAGCWSGTLEQLRARLDDGESYPTREAAWAIISQPLPTLPKE